MENKIIIETNIELVEDNFAEASVSLNPLFRWAKFILTDDKPNGNKQRIPREEFANLIRTGVFTPVKMKMGSISRGHEFAVPLGVITNLIEEDDKVIGLAALWEKEREADVNLLKSMKVNDVPLNLSWEIYHSDAELEDGGITALRGLCLRAATIVTNPAYKGRTPILNVASLEKEIMELEEIQAKLEETEKALEIASTSVAEKEEAVKAKDLALAEATEKLTAIEGELNSLKEFKQGIELAEQKKEKLASIKQKFAEAGIEKGDEYFQENEEKLLGMDEGALSFVLQEMASVLATASVTNQNLGDIPPLDSNKFSAKDPKKLGQALRELNKK